MAISFTLNSSSSGGLTNSITLPATVSAGDLLIAAQYDITNETIPSTPSGWTLINSITSGAAAGTLGIIVKIADGTEGGTTVTWLTGSDNMYTALSLTPDTTLLSLGSVTGTDAASSPSAISLDGTPSAGTLPLMLIYVGGSNGAINVSPDGDFNVRVTSPDGLELNATFYDTTDPTTTLTTSSGDTGRQTMALGNINLNFAVSVVVNVTGVSATGAVGSVTATGGASTAATGSEGTGQVGSPIVSGDASTAATGSGGTGQVGSVVAAAGADVAVTGLEASGAVGSVTVVASAAVSVTGVEGTGEVGTVAVAGDAVVSLTGVAATGEVGELNFPAVEVYLEGVSASGLVGSVTVNAVENVTVPLTGVSATGLVGTAVAAISESVSVTGVSATGQVGSVVAAAGAAALVTGLSAAGAVGSVTVQVGNTTVLLTGVGATGGVGSVFVWDQIVPDPGTAYSAIIPSPGTTYSPVSPSPGTSYSTIAPNPGTSYNGVEPPPSTSWEEIAA
jgi:hypothetical protein